MIKSAAEIALMQKASDVTIEAYKAAFATIRAGMSQSEFSSNISAAFSKLGFRGGASVQVGKYSALPHGSITPQTIRRDIGDIIKHVSQQDQVTVDFQGRTATLVTKKAKVGVISRGGNPTLSGPAPALAQTVSLNPTAESEAQRLQAVTEELARRRDARAQADAAAPAAPGRGP